MPIRQLSGGGRNAAAEQKDVPKQASLQEPRNAPNGINWQTSKSSDADLVGVLVSLNNL
jgi:hypothetical protein